MAPRGDWSDRYASAGRDDYEGILVPRLFAPWAELLADKVRMAARETVLDVACGPGTVVRVAAQRVGPSGVVIGVDFSPAMLAIAEEKPPLADAAPLEYRQAPADALPLPDGQVDVVTCQQGLQFFPDRPAALAEMHRVLRDGGRLGIATWCNIAECPPFHALAEGVAQVLGDELAAAYRGGPWGLTDPDELLSLVGRAGFTDVTVTRHELPLAFDGGAAQLVATLSVTAVAAEVTDANRQQLVDAVAKTAAPITEGGRIASTMAANLVLGRC